MADALNIPKKNNQFEAVSFVEDMTPHQLKVMIKRMWQNIQEMATELDSSRPDISIMLDNMLDGQKINYNSLREAKQYFKINGAIVEYNSIKNTMSVLDEHGNIVSENNQGYDFKIIENFIKKKLMSC